MRQKTTGRVRVPRRGVIGDRRRKEALELVRCCSKVRMEATRDRLETTRRRSEDRVPPQGRLKSLVVQR